MTASATAADDRGFRLDDITRLQQVTEARMAPGGERVAFLLRRPRDPFAGEDGEAFTELWVADGPGDARAYVRGEVAVARPRWAPAGDWIAFLAKRGDDEHEQLYRIPVDGGEARSLVRHDAAIESYAIGSDGERLVYLATAPLDDDRERLEQQGFDARVYETDQRPVRVWMAEIGGSEPGRGEALEIEGSASQPRWSPDGERLALALAPTPLIDDHYMRRDIVVIDADSGTIETTIDVPGKLGSFAWSPDGERLAVIAARSPHDTSAGRLYTVRATGGEPRERLADFAGHVEAVAWRNNQRLIYLAAEGVWSTVYSLALDGDRQPRALIEPPAPILGSMTMAADDERVAFAASTPEHPAEVHVYSPGAGLARWTDSNPWLAGRRLATQAPFRYQARDGLQLEGVLVQPLQREPGARHPLILAVHGGPESRDANGWLTDYNDPGQYAATRGYAVFYPNYRGSTGRGVEFAMSSQGDYAGAEFNDLVDAKQALVASGLVDAERVGITGGSYGGYASAWAATALSEHFAASVMYAGVSDLISKLGTTDIPREMHLVHARNWPWDDWYYYLRRSPIYHTENTRTPILIAHGEADTRVHPSQSIELYRFLKLRSEAPVRLVLYPDEPHGNRRAASRYDYARRMMRWMDHFVVGDGKALPRRSPDYDMSRLEQVKPDPSSRE